MKKFEAVSGDQSLFDLVGASDEHLYIVKNGTTLFSSPYFFGGEKIIAERKAIEKYVPKVGDDYRVGRLDGIHNCLHISKSGIVTGVYCDEVFSLNIKCHEFTKIDRSPNPVNMVEEKWVPKEGESFRVGGILYRDAKLFRDGCIDGMTEAFGKISIKTFYAFETIFERP